MLLFYKKVIKINIKIYIFINILGMNMSCDELIDIFIKVGGKMKCEYKTKKCIFYPQKISCNYNSSNLDNLLLYFQQD